MDNYLSTKQAAGIFGVSTRMIQKLVATNQIVAYKVGRCVRIPESSLEDYIQRNRMKGASQDIIPKAPYKPGDKLV